MSLFGRNVALLAVVGIAHIAMFPAAFGPFQVTHGPAAALDSSPVADFVLFCFFVLATFLTLNPVSRVRQTHPAIEDAVSYPRLTLALRC
jgi:hypothetical protein